MLEVKVSIYRLRVGAAGRQVGRQQLRFSCVAGDDDECAQARDRSCVAASELYRQGVRLSLTNGL